MAGEGRGVMMGRVGVHLRRGEGRACIIFQSPTDSHERSLISINACLF